MAENSKINWTHHTANFWWGCFKVSPGCASCYAETLSKRYGKQIWGPPAHSDREMKQGIWKDILKWDADAGRDGVRRRVFVSSMSDFLEDHPQVVEWRERAKELIRNLKNLDVLILTKRPENAERFLGDWYSDFPSHVWMGTSAENQFTFDSRLPYLFRIPAKIRFVSIEPQIEKIRLGHINSLILENDLHWIICGGESGPRARPFEWIWARYLLSESRDNRIAFWMKQGGGHPNKREDFKDIPEDLRIRELPV